MQPYLSWIPEIIEQLKKFEIYFTNQEIALFLSLVCMLILYIGYRLLARRLDKLEMHERANDEHGFGLKPIIKGACSAEFVDKLKDKISVSPIPPDIPLTLAQKVRINGPGVYLAKKEKDETEWNYILVIKGTYPFLYWICFNLKKPLDDRRELSPPVYEAEIKQYDPPPYIIGKKLA